MVLNAETIKAALPELGHKPSEYATGGRYFQSIEIPEGAKLTNAVIDLIGDHVLMYASDYPHGESHFPESVSLVLDWVWRRQTAVNLDGVFLSVKYAVPAMRRAGGGSISLLG